jgi:hypothetical protein
VIEVSREETSKRAALFLPVEGQRLISDNFFLNKSADEGISLSGCAELCQAGADSK